MNFKLKKALSTLLLLLFDCAVIYIVFIVAYTLRGYLSDWMGVSRFSFAIGDRFYYYYFPLVFSFLFMYEELYKKNFTFWIEAKKLLKATTFSMLIIISIITFNKDSLDISRLFLVMIWFLLIILFPLVRHEAKLLLFKFNLYKTSFVILSDNEMDACNVKKEIEGELNLCYEVEEVFLYNEYPSKFLLNKIKKIKDVSLIVLSQNSDNKENIINDLQCHVRELFFIPSYKNILLVNSTIK